MKCVDRIGIWIVGFCGGRKTGEPREKPRRRIEYKQQTHPTCDASSGNGNWDTVVGGEYCHHCAIPTPHKDVFIFYSLMVGRFTKKMYYVLRRFFPSLDESTRPSLEFRR